MASPLPKTKAPASAKYQPMVQSVAADAGPASPEMDQRGSGNMPSAAAPVPRRGGAFTNMASKPLARKSQTTSDSVHAMTAARLDA